MCDPPSLSFNGSDHVLLITPDCQVGPWSSMSGGSLHTINSKRQMEYDKIRSSKLTISYTNSPYTILQHSLLVILYEFYIFSPSTRNLIYIYFIGTLQLGTLKFTLDNR